MWRKFVTKEVIDHDLNIVENVSEIRKYGHPFTVVLQLAAYARWEWPFHQIHLDYSAKLLSPLAVFTRH